MEAQQCEAKVETASAYYLRDCGNKAKMEQSGHSYCGIHDPIKATAQQQQRDNKRAEKRARIIAIAVAHRNTRHNN